MAIGDNYPVLAGTAQQDDYVLGYDVHASPSGQTKLFPVSSLPAGTGGGGGGGVSLAGDLGGTDAVPEVVSTHLASPLPVAQGGSGSAYQVPGTIPFYPAVMQPVKWGFINNDVLSGSYRPLTNYTYNNGTSGVGATVTHNVSGALTIDGSTPALGDRVVVVDPYTDGTGNPPHPDGIYTVTNLGSSSTSWVLTRAADHNTAAVIGRYWAVNITNGTSWAGATVQVNVIDTEDGTANTAFVLGTTSMGISVSQYSSICIGQQASAQGFNSSAIGTQTVAVGQNSVALGNTAVANSDTSTAVGAYSIANGLYSTTLGYNSYTNGTQATAVGSLTNAYAPGMSAIAGGQVNNPADIQSTATMFGGQTTNATATALTLPYNQGYVFEDWNGYEHQDFSKTILVKATAVARRTDVAGTDSVWTAQGVLRGNGSSAYTWIGGTAPAFTVVAQDSGASSWSVAIAVDNTKPGITVTVTGAAGETIMWAVEVATVEVSSSSA